ncbi:MAG: DNA alkylation repair protein [Planctomycetia bacterium]|nr:DNA alkylation repair protein [Planctomycetia bacterium]
MSITPQKIHRQLYALAEPAYREFSSKILPGVPNILGVRLPHLQKLAKKIAQDDWRAFWIIAGNQTYEETLLQGLILRYVHPDPEEWFTYVADFVPRIHNWGICDSFCAGLKQIREFPHAGWHFLQPFFSHPQEFHVRFALVMLLNHYVTPSWIHHCLKKLHTFRHQEYYAQTGAAWAISICYIKFPDVTLPFLQENQLPVRVHNLSLRKICESRQISPETRQKIQNFKR